MIVVNLDVMMARRKMSLGELAEKVGITPANLSILKTGKAKASVSLLWRKSAGYWIASRGIFWNIGKGNDFSVNFCSDSDTSVSNRQRNKNNL